MKLKRLIIVAMLTAMAIVLSIVDSLIPMPVPGVKLGLANVIILIMLYEFKWYEAALTDILRIVLAGLLRGTLFQPVFFMSLVGGILSYIVMLLFSKIKLFKAILPSVLGAIFHCVGQVLVAIIIMGTNAVIAYLPFIALLSIATGVLCGIITAIYLSRSITHKFID